MKRAFAILGGLALATVALLLLIPTAIVGFEGGFQMRPILSQHSPDGKMEIIVTKRVAFPANEWVDPSVVVRAELRNVVTHRVFASERKSLAEDSDFSTPAIQWTPDAVHVVGFDRRNNQSLILKYRPNQIIGSLERTRISRIQL